MPSGRRPPAWSWPTAGASARYYLEGDKYWFGPSLDCIDYLDPLTDQRRRFTSDDCRVTATLADALPNYTWVMTIGMADDVPADIADRVIAKQVFTYTEKPLVFCCKDVNSVRDIYEMALVIAGGGNRSSGRRPPSSTTPSRSRRCSTTIRPSKRSSTVPNRASR